MYRPLETSACCALAGHRLDAAGATGGSDNTLRRPMPLEPHDLFRRPDDPSRIWRYVDFTKLVHMLETKTLFFPRRRTRRPFEGSFPRRTIERRPAFWVEHGFDEEFAASMSDEYRAQLRYKYINSWHVAESESAAMWRLYLKSDEGVAIRSTVGRLCSSFEKTDWRVFIGLVNYIDYDKDEIPEEKHVLAVPAQADELPTRERAPSDHSGLRTTSSCEGWRGDSARPCGASGTRHTRRVSLGRSPRTGVGIRTRYISLSALRTCC